MAATMSSDFELGFGPFRLHPGRRVLLEDGQPLRLGSRAFDLLVTLCERAGEVVSSTELLAAAWPNRVVEEGSVRVHIATLRKALGDGQHGRRYIANVPLRGYCLVAPVARLPAEGPPPQGPPGAALPRPPGAAPAAVPAAPAAAPLPLALTRIVGREDAVAELQQRVPQRRCITLVGPGGIGKTSVALAVARHLAEEQAFDVVFVELAALTEAAQVAQALASALGIVAPALNPLATLCAYLHDKQRLLLVLDNCEHLVGAAAELAEQVLRGAPGVHLLATSREALRIQGEWVQRLSSLRLPPPSLPAKAEEALAYAAVQLFVERAAAAVDGFVLRDADVPAVCEVCRGVDGIPLAIELAASAVDMMGLAGLAERLGGRLALLSRGRRTALPRHQTLRATLDWSHELLSPAERTLLMRSSVFRSAFSHAAAQAVFAGPAPPQPVDEALAGLVGKSLVATDIQGDAVFYRLLETTREYAAEKLAASGEGPEVARRHAHHMLALAREAEGQRSQQGGSPWLLSHARSVDDLRAAVAWAFSPQGDACLGVSLMAWSAPLWFALSLMAEFRSLAEQALALIDAAPADAPRAAAEDTMRLCEALGHALWHTRGGGPAMAASFSRALAIAEGLDATPYRLRCLWGLWLICNTVGDYRGSRRLAEQFGEIAAQASDAGVLLTHARMMSLGLHYYGDQARALAYAQQVLEHPLTINHTARNSGFQFDQRVAALTVLSRVLWLQGLPEQALQRAHDAVEEALAIGHALSLCYAIANGAGPVAFWAGDITMARRYTGLLQQRADERSLYFWQAFAAGFQLLLQLHDGGRADAAHAAMLHPAMGALLRETMVTVQPCLADEAVLARGASGDAGWCSAELLRVQAERALEAGQAADAEAGFERGIVVAREQQALSWELRCSTSLASLWASRGERQRAQALLSGVLARFTEGQGTADLQRAAALCQAWAA
jgi:predicted ATPase/DNA-binding winged helix-turn-helix (wHTH) protein